MQVNILPAAHPAVMTMFSFPEIPQEARAWVSNQLSSVSTLSEQGKQFFDKAAEVYRDFTSGAISRAARGIVRSVKGLAHPNMIIPLEAFSDIQSAQPLMQRYIMAEPTIRSIYHRQLCDGYSDSYVDYHPGDVGEDHYDFRRVMNGIVHSTRSVDGEELYHYTNYYEDLIAGDRELTAEEQFIILDTWEAVKAAVFAKIDPTDIFNGKLGI